ncbi:metal ABC transporter permease [Roseicitreum antarcticum]|uniref:Manganese/zinc/iron transport system permease protein n=1 Tax=Roseicitreum antarcticum TaxID=564137 RepID=A0A1H3BVJ9_9RHOB|nr:metal ABC transporter permease [Roseicitreum antarcticum]SDX45876.1 manganese/zinc/iron transport system permease protein [Roseicitreum antarcticum]
MIAAFFDNIPAMILLTGALVAASGALLGTFLVLRGSAMLTDAISHSIVFGIIIVWLLTGATAGIIPVLGAALTGVLTVILSEAVTRSGLVRSDAAVGLVFPALFAAGVILISLFARDVHIDVDTVLLGEITFVWLDTVALGGVPVPRAVLTLAIVFAVNLGFVLALWKELKLTVFDPALAAALGFFPALIFYALLTLTSVTAVASFDAVGAVLFIAFVIVPPATAFLLTRRLGVMVLLAVGFGVASSAAGYALAVAWDVSIGGMMASMTGVFFTAALLFAPRDGLIAQTLHRRVQKLDNDCITLVAHLYTHQDDANAAEENTATALHTHLRWRAPRVQAALLRALDREMIWREGERLHLAPKGSATARQIFEPWGMGADGSEGGSSLARDRGRGDA